MRLRLRQGDLSAALRWAENCDSLGDVELDFVQQLTWVRIQLAQIRSTSSDSLIGGATNVLAAVLKGAESGAWAGHVIESLLLHALILHAQNDRPGALAALQRALTLAEPGGYLRLFLDEGEPMRLMILDFRFWIAKQTRIENQASISTYADKLLAAFTKDDKMTR